MDNRLTDRRTFCVSLVGLGAALTSCGGDNPGGPSSTNVTQLPTLSGSVSGSTIQVNAASGSPIASAGGAALVQSSAGSFLVTRISDVAATVVTATCTHEGCTVTGIDSQTYVCPCHGSRYNTNGGVVNGPATRPLQQYASQISGGTLSFSI